MSAFVLKMQNFYYHNPLFFTHNAEKCPLCLQTDESSFSSLSNRVQNPLGGHADTADLNPNPHFCHSFFMSQSSFIYCISPIGSHWLRNTFSFQDVTHQSSITHFFVLCISSWQTGLTLWFEQKSVKTGEHQGSIMARCLFTCLLPRVVI